MKLIQDIAQIKADEPAIVTVGTFDGVHLGHKAILEYLVRKGAEKNMLSTLVTFFPHPREVVFGEKVPLLTTIEERAAICEQLGVQQFLVVSFTREFSQLPPEEFIRDTLVERAGMKEIVVGHDHGFGKDRIGTEKLLHARGDREGFVVDVIPDVLLADRKISSSAIRNSISGPGDVDLARSMLGYNYGFTARTIRGLGRGRSIGFPTANLTELSGRKLIPADGVYAVRVLIEGVHESHVGMMNIGIRPTFEGSGRHMEVHIIGLDEDLYDQELRVEFVSRIRSEKKFEGISELVQQLKADRQRCIAALGNYP